MREILLLAFLCMFCVIGCSGMATKEEVIVLYKHHNCSLMEYHKAKSQFTEEEQLAITTRYRTVDDLFKKILGYKQDE